MNIFAGTPQASGLGLDYAGTIENPVASTANDEEIREGIKQDFSLRFFKPAAALIEAGFAFSSFFQIIAALQSMIPLAKGYSRKEDEFIEVLDDLLPAYDVKSLYRTARCGFFHVGGPDKSGAGDTVRIKVTNDHPELHSPTVNANKEIVLDAGTFLSDAQATLDKLLDDPRWWPDIKSFYEHFRVTVWSEKQ